MIGHCDCCDKGPRELSFVVAYGLETWACWECRGEDEPGDGDDDREAA